MTQSHAPPSADPGHDSVRAALGDPQVMAKLATAARINLRRWMKYASQAALEQAVEEVVSSTVVAVVSELELVGSGIVVVSQPVVTNGSHAGPAAVDAPVVSSSITMLSSEPVRSARVPRRRTSRLAVTPCSSPCGAIRLSGALSPSRPPGQTWCTEQE